MGVGNTVAARVAAGMMLAACIAAPLQAADAPSPAGPRFIASQLVDLSRQALRNPALPPELAAKEATLLLSWAQQLQESTNAPDPSTLRMLADAARAAEKPALHRDTLRKLIAADKGDLVAQVEYLDLLATGAQTLEERTRVYTSALEQPSLHAQVRSEMAMRLSQLALERGERAAEQTFLTRAVSLNDVNVAALRGLVRVAAANPRAVPERLSALIALIVANPYQPDAWLELSRICAGANMHDRAADFLGVALEQMQLAGTGGDGGLYLDYAFELAIAGRRRDAASVLNSLAALPDAPLPALLAAQLVAEGAATTAPSATAPATSSIAERIVTAISAMAKEAADGGNPSSYADAAGIALTVLPPTAGATVMAQAAEWIDAYARQVPAEDVTLARLRGWQLFRAGKLDDARTALEKVAEADPMSAIGLARVLIAQQKNADAGRLLQDVWSSHPTGLLALQTTDAARAASVKLEDTQWTRQLTGLAARIPPGIVIAHRQPREVQLLSVSLDRINVSPGEPLTLTARVMNTTPRPLPIGVARMGLAGTVPTSFGLWAQLRNSSQPVGIYAIEDTSRVFRLEAHASIEMKLRVDQGTLAAAFASNPLQSSSATVRVISAPMVTAAGEVRPGLGGQQADAGDVSRQAFPLRAAADFEIFLKQLAAAGTAPATERSLAQVLATGRLLEILSGPPTTQPAVQNLGDPGTARQSLAGTLAAVAAARDPLLRAATALVAPVNLQDPALEKAVAALADDAEPLVRALWARRLANTARSGNAAAAEVLRQRAASEKDEPVKEWLTLLISELSPPATQPR